MVWLETFILGEISLQKHHFWRSFEKSEVLFFLYFFQISLTQGQFWQSLKMSSIIHCD